MAQWLSATTCARGCRRGGAHELEEELHVVVVEVVRGEIEAAQAVAHLAPSKRDKRKADTREGGITTNPSLAPRAPARGGLLYCFLFLSWQPCALRFSLCFLEAAHDILGPT